MLGAVDSAVGLGASTRIILLKSCDIAGRQSITLWQIALQVLNFTTLRGGFVVPCWSASGTCLVPESSPSAGFRAFGRSPIASNTPPPSQSVSERPAEATTVVALTLRLGFSRPCQSSCLHPSI